MKANTARITGTVMYTEAVRTSEDGLKSTAVAVLKEGGSVNLDTPVAVIVVGDDAVEVSKMSLGEAIDIHAEIEVVLGNYINFNGDKIVFPKTTFINGKLL